MPLDPLEKFLPLEIVLSTAEKYPIFSENPTGSFAFAPFFCFRWTIHELLSAKKAEIINFCKCVKMLPKSLE